MSSERRVYRVTGVWTRGYVEDYGYPPNQRVRHFLTKRAATKRAQMWREGVEQDWGVSGPIDPYDESAPFGIPPADSVTIEESAPIYFATHPATADKGEHAPNEETA